LGACRARTHIEDMTHSGVTSNASRQVLALWIERRTDVTRDGLHPTPEAKDA